MPKAQPNGPSRPITGRAESNAAYRRNECKELQLRNHEAVTKKHGKWLNTARRHKISVGDTFVEFKNEFFTILLQLETTQTTYIGWANIVKQWRESFTGHAMPMHLAPFRAGPKAREFKKHGIENMLFKEQLSRLRYKWQRQ